MKNFLVALIISLSFSIQSVGGDGADYAGAVVGTFTGFGIGHIFQGRYFLKGLMFTAIDVVGISYVASGLATCIVNGVAQNNCGGGNNVSTGGTILVVSRIWQIIDLFSFAANPSGHSFYIVPSQNGTLVGWNYKF